MNFRQGNIAATGAITLPNERYGFYLKGVFITKWRLTPLIHCTKVCDQPTSKPYWAKKTKLFTVEILRVVCPINMVT